jgi:hypothetical protein
MPLAVEKQNMDERWQPLKEHRVFVMQVCLERAAAC